jgi:hypothetical protein
MDRWFSADDASEAGWRRVLSAQRDLRQGRVDQALGAIAAIGTDFPDLDRDDRLDLTLRAAAMMTRENQSARARDLLITAIKQSAGHSEDKIDELLDQLEQTSSNDDPFSSMLDRLATDTAVPFLARIVVRDRRVQALRDDEHSDQAESLLRGAVAEEKEEYARFRAATLLAELLEDEHEDRSEAVKVLKELLGGLKRGDLAHRVRETIKGLEKKPENVDN